MGLIHYRNVLARGLGYYDPDVALGANCHDRRCRQGPLPGRSLVRPLRGGKKTPRTRTLALVLYADSARVQGLSLGGV